MSDVLGFCTRCIRVRWLAEVLGYYKGGAPWGVCRQCNREANEPAPEEEAMEG